MYGDQQYQQSLKMQEFMKYREASDYSNMDSIVKAFPHLKNINPSEPINVQPKSKGVIIRSANDDNVHKGIKHGIWTTTDKNKAKLEQLWHCHMTQNSDIFLFFSVVKSGMFEGVAKLVSGYHKETFPYWWENHSMKFKGFFLIEWVYIKDVNYKHFQKLVNSQGQKVTVSKDCDFLTQQTTKSMLEVFQTRPLKRNIFIDFGYMDKREKNYIRKKHQLTQKQIYMQQQQEFFSMLNGNNNCLKQPLNSASIPTSMLPADICRSNNNDNKFGFQMNPLIRPKKK